MSAGALLALLVLPALGTAQQTKKVLVADLPLVEQTRIELERAEREGDASDLLDEARAAERSGDWTRAARLYRKSADLRTGGDTLAGRVFALAGRAYYFGDEPKQSSVMYEEAGERSLIHGDVTAAARYFTLAAVAAQERGQNVRAVELGWKAHHLIRSPALSQSERDQLRPYLRISTG
jgi:hypothetical protein